MSSRDPAFTCTSCGIDIHGSATFHVGLAFCCAGCVAGGPCICSYDCQAPVSGVAGSTASTRDQSRPRLVTDIGPAWHAATESADDDPGEERAGQPSAALAGGRQG